MPTGGDVRQVAKYSREWIEGEGTRYWVWVAPDGTTTHISMELLPTIELRLELLKHWYSMKVYPFKRLRDIAEFEIRTGEKWE